MKFSVDEKIFTKWPEVKIGVLVLTNIDNQTSKPKILNNLRKLEEEEKSKLTGSDFNLMPEIAVWKNAYRDFGSNPRDFRSSVEALLRRVRTGSLLPSINNLVDLYNFLSIKHHLPAGAEDLDKIVGNIELTFAKGSEKGKYIGSDDEDVCYEGEVIYQDDDGFVCRRWNWREADRTKIEKETKNAVLVFEAIPPVSSEKLAEVMSEAKNLIKQYLEGEQSEFVLDKNLPGIEINFQSVKKISADTKNTISRKKIATVTKQKATTTNSTPGVGLQDKKILPPKEFVSYKIATALQCAGITAYPDFKIKLEDIHLEHPVGETHGDYSSNIALRLTKELKKSPLIIANKFAEELNKSLPEFLEKVEVVKPGFLNFFLSPKFLLKKTDEIITAGNNFGKSSDAKGKKIILEFTDPNPFKEFHIGHVYTNTVGESLSRLQEYIGKTVKRANYQGDVGMHVAKSVWGMRKKMVEEKITLDNLSQQEIHQRIKFLGQAYALGSSKFEDSKEAQEEMKDINYLVYVSAQKMLKEEKNWQPQVDYQQYIYGNKFLLEEIEKIYRAGRSWSLEYFELIYQRLGTRFDYYYFESVVGEYGVKIVRENLNKGLFEKHDGAVVFRGEKFGYHTRVFINSLGLPTYEAKELGLAPTKFQDFAYTESVIITGNEIEEYFKVLIAALTHINPQLGKITKHLPHGMVRLPEGKMSSRTGKVITGEMFLNRARDEALKKFQTKSQTIIGENLAEQIGIGAIKYAFLKNSIGKDIIFNMEESLSLQGNSGPYLQYTHARAKSVLIKNNPTSSRPAELRVASKLEAEETAILRSLYKFPEVVLSAAQNFAPNVLCNYLFDLAQKFNSFYDKLPILKAEKESREVRLKIVTATAQILKNGLYLLGIQAPDRM